MEHNPNLRLHIEEDVSAAQAVAHTLVSVLPEAKTICKQFEQATGWVLSYLPKPKTVSSFERNHQLPIFGKFEITDLSASQPPGQPAVHRGNCESVVDSINALVQRLATAELLVWQNENYSEPTGRQFNDTQFSSNDSDLLATLLRTAADNVSASGAALYLLDDQTTQLKLRATIGTKEASGKLQSIRQLEHALADLEALVGSVVTINSPEVARSWKIPEPYRYGTCVMIGEPSLPLGTIWIFFEQATTLSSQETAMLESLSVKIAEELQERGKVRQDEGPSLIEHELQMASRLNDCRLPSFPPEVDGWKIAGWTHRQNHLAGVFHEWAVTPTGNLSVAIGQIAGPMLSAAINANNLRSLICAHRDYRHSAQSMAGKLNENVWYNSPGDDLASAIYALIDPETSHVQIVNAGDGGVVYRNAKGIQSIDQFQHPLGVELESDFNQWEGTLSESDTIVMFSQGLRNALCESFSSNDDAQLLGDILEQFPGQPHAIVNAIEDLFFQCDFQHVAGDLSVIVLAKSSAPTQMPYAAAEVSRDILAELQMNETDRLETLRDELASYPDYFGTDSAEDSADYDPADDIDLPPSSGKNPGSPTIDAAPVIENLNSEIDDSSFDEWESDNALEEDKDEVSFQEDAASEPENQIEKTTSPKPKAKPKAKLKAAKSKIVKPKPTQSRATQSKSSQATAAKKIGKKSSTAKQPPSKSTKFANASTKVSPKTKPHEKTKAASKIKSRVKPKTLPANTTAKMPAPAKGIVTKTRKATTVAKTPAAQVRTAQVRAGQASQVSDSNPAKSRLGKRSSAKSTLQTTATNPKVKPKVKPKAAKISTARPTKAKPLTATKVTLPVKTTAKAVAANKHATASSAPKKRSAPKKLPARKTSQTIKDVATTSKLAIRVNAKQAREKSATKSATKSASRVKTPKKKLSGSQSRD